MHGRTNVAFQCWTWGDSHRVGIRDNGLREKGVYACVRTLLQYSQRGPITQAGVTFQEISTDVRLGPQLSRRRSREGCGGVKWVAWRKREGRWMSLIRLGKISQLYGVWGRALISRVSLPFFLCLCALLLSLVEWVIASLWCWQHETYLPEWHWFCFLSNLIWDKWGFQLNIHEAKSVLGI